MTDPTTTNTPQDTPLENTGAPPAITILVKDTINFELAINCQVPNIDYALNMLLQAIRIFEAERRKQEARDLAAELANNRKIITPLQ